MNIKSEIAALMRSNGFMLLRTNNHMIWLHPSGAKVTTSCSPKGNPLRQIAQDIRRELKKAA